jgi:hypothetical protein
MDLERPSRLFDAAVAGAARAGRGEPALSARDRLDRRARVLQSLAEEI